MPHKKLVQYKIVERTAPEFRRIMLGCTIISTEIHGIKNNCQLSKECSHDTNCEIEAKELCVV